LDDPTQARSLARQLNEIYDLRGHAFRIEEVAGGMQLLTRPQFATWLRRLEHVHGEEVLSSGMLECLSIVAYRQPVMRAEIEAIRGVGCDEVLRQLMQRDLVRIAGRHEELGRPYLYGTTKRFLQLFGLQSLDSLPRAQKIRQAEAETATRLRADGERTSESISEEEISDASTSG
jgi:segregation and condensation protein B